MINEEVKCDCECGETTCIECRAYINYLVTPHSQQEAWKKLKENFEANVLDGDECINFKCGAITIDAEYMFDWIENLLSTQREEYDTRVNGFIKEKITKLETEFRNIEDNQESFENIGGRQALLELLVALAKQTLQGGRTKAK